MPLAEERRKQLDGIIDQMVKNGEADNAVQFVVNDFKSKYENEQPTPPPQQTSISPFDRAKALPKVALNFGAGIAAFPFNTPQWTVGMQEKYSGKPYEGLLTTKIGDKTFAQLAQDLGTKIQGVGGYATPQTPAEKEGVDVMNYPFKLLGKGGEFAGGIANTLTGNPSWGTLVEGGVNLAPMFFGSKGGKEIAAKVIEKVPRVGEFLAEKGYLSALKPGKKFTREEQIAMAQQGLEHWDVVKGNIDKLKNQVTESTASIDTIINQGTTQGGTIAKAPLLNALQKVRDQWPNWSADDTFIRMVDDIESRPGRIPISEAQILKRQLNHAFDRQSSTLLIQGERALRHSILDQQISQYPALKDLGLNEKAMINLEGAIENRIKGMSAKDLISVGTMMKTGLGMGAFAKFGHAPEVALAYLTALAIDHPTVKSALSIALNQASKTARYVGKESVKAAIPIPPIQIGQDKYTQMANEWLNNL